MNAKNWIKAYAAAWLTVALLDALWLGWLARGFYAEQMAEVIAGTVRPLPVVVFYLAYPVALVALGLLPRPATWRGAALRCAGLGATAYATYNLTNWATLEFWTATLTAVDVTWGAAMSAAAGVTAWCATRTRAH